MHQVAHSNASNLSPNDNVCIKLEETDQALAYAVLSNDGLGGVIIADKEYPGKVAIKIIHEMLDMFRKSVNSMTYAATQKDLEISFPPIEAMIKKYQDPKEADKLLKLESELGQVQQMLTKTMTDVGSVKRDSLLREALNSTTSWKSQATSPR